MSHRMSDAWFGIAIDRRPCSPCSRGCSRGVKVLTIYLVLRVPPLGTALPRGGALEAGHRSSGNTQEHAFSSRVRDQNTRVLLPIPKGTRRSWQCANNWRTNDSRAK